jgi:hypothetical protein
MTKPIKCGACAQTHKTVEEVRLCHNTKGVFAEDNQVGIKRSKTTNVVKTAKKEEPKTYVVHTFLTKESAEAFAAKTLNARIGTTKVKYVNGVAEKTYQVIVSLK